MRFALLAVTVWVAAFALVAAADLVIPAIRWPLLIVTTVGLVWLAVRKGGRP